MNNDDLVKKIGDIVDEKINKALDPIKNQLGDPESGLKRINEKLDTLWDQAVELTENMTEVQETLDSHTIFLTRIETKVEHSIENIQKINKRVGNVENKLGVVPPPELTIVR